MRTVRMLRSHEVEEIGKSKQSYLDSSTRKSLSTTIRQMAAILENCASLDQDTSLAGQQAARYFLSIHRSRIVR